MKSSQTNFNLQLTGSYLVRSNYYCANNSKVCNNENIESCKIATAMQPCNPRNPDNRIVAKK